MTVGPPPERIALVTDFGASPYIGQLALLAAEFAPALPVIDLIHDLPAFRPELAAYLLPGLIRKMPPRTLYLCVVDPGVGGERAALVMRCGSDQQANWLVGPDNGLMAMVATQTKAEIALWQVDWRPAEHSHSFHGRDLFLPIALALTTGRLPGPARRLERYQLIGHHWPAELAQVLYVDHYGNLITGLQAEHADGTATLRLGETRINAARTFCMLPPGTAFWYRNAFDLVEIAVNQGQAHQRFGVGSGAKVAWDTL